MNGRILLLLALALLSYGSLQASYSLGQVLPTEQWSLALQSNAPPAVEVTTVGKFKLSLAGCQLTYEGSGKSGAVSFEFPGQCRFSRDGKGEIRVIRTGKTQTLLLEGSREEGLANQSQTKDCLTYIRGVVITAKEVRLSVQTQKVAQCLPAAWDEKMFHVFAARTQPIASSPRK